MTQTSNHATTEASLLDRLSELLQEESISDIHLSSGAEIWVRRSGEMEKIVDSVVSANEINTWLAHRYKGNSPALQIKTLGGQDDFALNLRQWRVRCHAYLTKDGLDVSLRRLSNVIPDVQSLGIPLAVQNFMKAPQGLVLVTGPTGSGKTTTLASLIELLNTTTASRIVTLEDPIEYIYTDKTSRIRQRLVSKSSEGNCDSFDLGVVAAMREDPDVILIGEVRDKQTVEAALNAAQTGHLVLATLHTNSAPESINRILSYFPESERDLARSVLSSVLVGIVSQRLVKKKEGGRTCAFEIMRSTPQIRVQIGSDKLNLINQEMNSGAKDGQITLNKSLEKLYRDGAIELDRALATANDRSALEKLLGVSV